MSSVQGLNALELSVEHSRTQNYKPDEYVLHFQLAMVPIPKLLYFNRYYYSLGAFIYSHISQVNLTIAFLDTLNKCNNQGLEKATDDSMREFCNTEMSSPAHSTSNSQLHPL